LQPGTGVTRSLVPALLLLAVAGGSRCTEQPVFVERALATRGAAFRYRVYLPAHHKRLRKWPVIVFLHGSGERGDDNLRQLATGLGPALQQHPERFQALVLLVQCPNGQEWYGENEANVFAALQKTIAEFHGDRTRVYLTGISMGGAGVWYMARHRNVFAAVVPVCGEVVRQRGDPFPTPLPDDLRQLLDATDPYLALARAIGRAPVWAFHGRRDEVIPVTESRRMTAALKHAGGNVRYTEYPDEGHGCWDEAYGDPELWRWMFRKKLR
jgi:predicted peptidase